MPTRLSFSQCPYYLGTLAHLICDHHIKMTGLLTSQCQKKYLPMLEVSKVGFSTLRCSRNVAGFMLADPLGSMSRMRHAGSLCQGPEWQAGFSAKLQRVHPHFPLNFTFVGFFGVTSKQMALTQSF